MTQYPYVAVYHEAEVYYAAQHILPLLIRYEFPDVTRSPIHETARIVAGARTIPSRNQWDCRSTLSSFVIGERGAQV